MELVAVGVGAAPDEMDLPITYGDDASQIVGSIDLHRV
jgi:hypothetical protein